MGLKTDFFKSDEAKGVLGQLFESSGEGIMVFDAKGTIVASNPRSLDMFGYQEEELIGRSVEQLIPKNHRDKHVGKREGYVKKPAIRSMGAGLDLEGLRKDDSTFPLEISLSYLTRENQVIVVAFITDISIRKVHEKKLEEHTNELERLVRERTRELEQMNMGLESQIQERKQAELALKKSLEDVKKAEKEILKALEKEKELSELKSRFVSMASHEFRTPLTTIASSANLIKKYPESNQQDKREKHIGRIQNNVKNLTGILNDFLSLEKLESGAIQLKLEKISLHSVLEEAIQDLSVILKKGQTIDCQKGEDVLVITDPYLLQNLLYNLVSNASKYSDENKPIIVRCLSDSDQIKIEVEDEGIGIPKAEQKNMFERFFRANNVTNIQGTGLGLNIVKKYVDLLRGNISFESEEGKGSIFRVTLPTT